MFKGIVALSSLAFVAVAVPALPANAAPVVKCGSTVTGDISLSGDLHCVGTALYVKLAKPGPLHIDLRGHQLRGGGTGAGIFIENDSASVRPLIVTSGSIARFGAAFNTGGPGVNTLVASGVRLAANTSWLPITSGFHTISVINSSISNSASGGAPVEAALTVIGSHFTNAGITSSDETSNYLNGNTFDVGGFSHGISSNLIAVGNTFTNCGTGIGIPDVFSTGGTRIDYNIFMTCKIGLSLSTVGGYATVDGNSFIHNGTGFVFDAGAAATVRVTANRFLRNRGHGLVGTGTPKVTVTGNQALNNSGNGIKVMNVSDGGGNTGAGDHVLPDCVGVACM